MSDNPCLAWAAGFFDGEGSVSVHVERTKKGFVMFVVHVTVTNTHLESLEKFNEVICGAGRIYAIKARPSRKGVYCLQLRAKRAGEALRSLLPFSVTKKRQMELAIELRDMKQGVPFQCRTEEETRRMFEIAKEMRDLNGNHRLKSVLYQQFEEQYQVIG